jgi:hypothetical protein
MVRSFNMIMIIALTTLIQGCGSQQTGFKVETESIEEAAVVEEVPEEARKPFKRFKVYTDGNSPDNHYAPSGWMGDYADIGIAKDHFDNPHSGTTAFKVMYSAKATRGANWAGIYWQNPPNNWGAIEKGFDLTGASRLVFWARGEKGGERIEEFRVGGIPGDFPDSDISGIGPIVLNAEWTQYVIDLEDRDLTHIIGGFMWSANVDGNPEGAVFYLDDIWYE